MDLRYKLRRAFRAPSPYYSDGYKIGHKMMLALGTLFLYGTWIPRSIKHAPKGVEKIVSAGQQLMIRWLHSEWQENFFDQPKEAAIKFSEDMSKYLGLPFNGKHFEDLYMLGYLPVRIKSLPEGIETGPNIPHMTFINTKEGFAWLTLYLETIVSSLAWKTSTSATIALQYKRNLYKCIMKTDPSNIGLMDFLAHDFSARGLSPWDSLSSGLGHAFSFRGSDSIIVIPAARFYYDEPEDEVCINSVNASEHSVTCTQLFYYEDRLRRGLEDDTIKKYYNFDCKCEGSVEEPDYLAIAEYMNLRDWLQRFPEGILSYVGDTMNLWKVLTHVIPRLKSEIMGRNGKLVIRPDSGDPVDIICGTSDYIDKEGNYWRSPNSIERSCGRVLRYPEDPIPSTKGTIELLWEIFGGTVNEKGYKVLDPHIGAIYGDSITLARQIEIYERLELKKFACTNIVLGIGSFTYQYNTRDTCGFAAKGAWFSTAERGYDIYKDPVTDNGTKKSLKGRVAVFKDEVTGEYYVRTQCLPEEEESGLLMTIYQDGEFFNQTTLTQIRKSINSLL